MAEARRVEQVGVVIPARDEQEHLHDALRSVVEAAATCGRSVEVLVVLDSCRDRSADIVAQWSATCAQLAPEVAVTGVEVQHTNVGLARRIGMAVLLRRLGVVGSWLCTTDADCRVPVDWLSRHITYAESGAQVVSGTVRVRDWAGRSPAVRRAAVLGYASAARHVHGANLTFDAAAYLAVGGFRSLTAHEDVGLIAQFEQAGIPVLYASDVPVITSARRHGRAPKGFAAYLNALEVAASDA